ncbi:hypothetical protein F443_06837 [Phytophthora nicotianae P1569]|uniref:SWIM-type domain-containing protein n=1 Tax=Phytophthora nicotianae P1569 TaxID=1317065 RepID=V9FFM8_PHYNI|nr:hypothetical protein F443_06837 [Phytophthora nicotianae P1569]
MLDDNAFTFGYNVNEDGTPAIGEGVDDDPTIVGISTPCVVEMLRYAAKYVLHIDTTYKLDQSGYPVLVLGISDQSRSFHLVAMFVTSQQTGGLISMALQSVFDVFKVITGNYPDIRYCVADTDKAQYNAVMDTTSSKRSRSSNGALTYWGCYHTPTGFATTNNPVEQFNNAIKRDYSLRTLLKLEALAEQLSLMCRYRSRRTYVFAVESKPNRDMQDRYKYLQKNGRLSVIQSHKHGLDFLLDGPIETHIAYAYQLGAQPRLPTPDTGLERKKLGKRNKHRMETAEQPVGGWRVDMEEKSCPCRSWYKYRLCVHVLAALYASGKPIPGEKQVKKRFVNRSCKRKGRNAAVSPVLSYK